MQSKLFAVAIPVFFVSFACHAECRKGSNPEYQACLETELGATNRMEVASYARLKRAIDRSQFEGYSRDEVLRELKSSEVAWKKYRDASCSLEGSLFNGGTGTIERLVIDHCLIDENKNRSNVLSKLVDQLAVPDGGK